MLSEKEKERYQRHISLSQIGKEGQEKLKAAKVLVIGAGGLGCPVLQYLTSAGVDTIGIVDFDRVSLSNLQRQILFNDQDIGNLKVESAISHLEKLNPYTKFQSYPTKLETSNSEEIVQQYDLVIDCTDSIPTRYIINDASIRTNVPMIYGSIHAFEGQVSVFNYKGNASYRCVFPEGNSLTSATCNDTGVLGVLSGMIGTMQANEALKILLNIGKPLVNKLLVFNALDNSINYFDIIPNQKEIEKVKNQINNSNHNMSKKEISREEFLKIADDVIILDVREHWEKPELNYNNVIQCSIDDLDDEVDELPRDKEIYVICQTGGRSSNAILFLESQYDFDNLVNVKDGLIG